MTKKALLLSFVVLTITIISVVNLQIFKNNPTNSNDLLVQNIEILAEAEIIIMPYVFQHGHDLIFCHTMYQGSVKVSYYRTNCTYGSYYNICPCDKVIVG